MAGDHSSASSPTYRRARLTIPEGKEGNYGFFRPTEEVMAAWHRTEEIAEVLQARVIVFQCPPSFSEEERNVANMRQFFTTIGRKFLNLSMYDDALRFEALVKEETG